jgi:hypothetical protein
VVGYGFGDEHINGILSQALHANPNKRLIAVTSFGELSESHKAEKKDKFRDYIAHQLGIKKPDDERIVVYASTAKYFLENELTLSEMSKHFPEEETIFEEIAPETPAPSEIDGTHAVNEDEPTAAAEPTAEIASLEDRSPAE